MTKEELQEQLLKDLNKHENEVIQRINLLLANIPIKAKSLDLCIFPSQEENGMFNIYASVDGPDLYVLIKELESYANIFNPKYTANGIDPHIPTVDSRAVDYNTNDVVVDCVAKWLKDVCQKTNRPNLQIPIYITSDADYGTITPIELYK